VTDEDDLIRRSDIFRDLLVKRILFWYALAPVVRFLSMNQMMMEIVRIGPRKKANAVVEVSCFLDRWGTLGGDTLQ